MSKFTIINTKLCAPVVMLLTQYNVKLLKQLESSYYYLKKKKKNWSKYQSKRQEQSQHLDFLIDPSFQEINRVFVLSTEN